MSEDPKEVYGDIYPCYGDVERGVFAPGINSTPNFNPTGSNLTLVKLQESMDSLPKFPKLPPYYRAHPITISNMIATLPPADGPIPAFSGVQIREDVSVPLSEFLPPEGWTE